MLRGGGNRYGMRMDMELNKMHSCTSLKDSNYIFSWIKLYKTIKLINILTI